MDTEYDFIQTINATQLLDEMTTAGLPIPDYINTAGTSVAIFYVSPLTSGQQATLTTVVSMHAANPNYITLAQQAQINTLIAYLNNTNTTISNTARAVMIQNLAFHLPPGLITTVNAQIQAIVGG